MKIYNYNYNYNYDYDHDYGEGDESVENTEQSPNGHDWYAGAALLAALTLLVVLTALLAGCDPRGGEPVPARSVDVQLTVVK